MKKLLFGFPGYNRQASRKMNGHHSRYTVHDSPLTLPYCASEILTCAPTLVSIVGADDEMYGFTRR